MTIGLSADQQRNHLLNAEIIQTQFITASWTLHGGHPRPRRIQ